ncbi:MAG: orotidine-5'-phosphate decarboxylase, partial [Zetaproteobacteria bacterium]|nr:orotidine-5'-phosphate decarboxylase [Zetaproteobacteria bacterium]
MRDRLVVALDVPDLDSALAMREKVGSEAGWLKVGLRLFVAEGPSLVRKLAEEHKIFLDLKFHDIPNTVAEAVESAGKLGVQMLNVHAVGGPDMLKRASEAASEFPEMKLIAVTVLT